MIANGPSQGAITLAIEQINGGNLREALHLLDAMLERPLSSLPEADRFGAYLSRGTARAMLSKEAELMGAPPHPPPPA